MASMNYFDSCRKNLTYFFEMEVSNGNACHNKITNLHGYGCFSYMDKWTVMQLKQVKCSQNR